MVKNGLLSVFFFVKNLNNIKSAKSHFKKILIGHYLRPYLQPLSVFLKVFTINLRISCSVSFSNLDPYGKKKLLNYKKKTA